jgi:microsomal dipeptidase-like Zn-dependent dipeptidase
MTQKRLFFAAFLAILAPVSTLAHAAGAGVVSPLPLDRATVELHAHLFMKEGMTWAFRGDFDGPLKADDWRSKFSSQANPETLDRSEMGITVATLYAHPLFTLSLRDSVRRQIALAEKFVAEHPYWVIARNASQARKALGEGKRVMVLALEGAAGIIESEEDLREFVDEKGVRIVTLLHLMDDDFGGVAFLSGIKALSSPWALLRQWTRRLVHGIDAGSELGTEKGAPLLNSNGLSDAGHALALKLMEHGVWIDLAHASDASTRALVEIHEKARLPLLYTHTALRKYHHAERGIAEWELQAVAKSGGFLGFMPSEEMMDGTLPASGDEKGCGGGIRALARQYTEAAAVIGADSIAMGSDYNGGIMHLRPAAVGCEIGAGLDAEGLWHIGLVPGLWDSLEKLGAPVPRPRRRMIDRFLETWERVTAFKKGKVE